MKKIDFLYKNFDVDFFLKHLKSNKDNEEPIQYAVLNSVKDLQSIKSKLSYFKYYKGNSKNVFTEFLKKFPNTYKDADIDIFFRKKKLISDSIKQLRDETETFEFYDLKKTLIVKGEFFRRLSKFFEITFYASIRRKDYPEVTWEDAYLLYCKRDKIYRLCVFFFDEDGNDNEYIYREFKTKPNNFILLEILKKKGMEYVSKENISVNLSPPFKFSSYWKKEHKKAQLENHVDSKIIKNETDFLKNYADNQSIFYYLNKDPEKYYKIIRPEKQKSNDIRISFVFPNNKIKSSSQEAKFIIRLFSQYWNNNPKEKINNNNFFKYLMSPKLNWYNDKLLIMDLIYKCNDLDGLMSLINPKFLKDKLLVEEVRILKLFRNKSKDFLMKVFKKNEKMLNDLFANYVPDYVKNNFSIMNDILKIDINLMRYIGEELKKNKVFMSKVNQIVKSK